MCAMSITDLSAYCSLTRDIARCILHSQIEARLGRALLQLSAEHTGRQIDVTHQQLADMIGTSREEVTKKLQPLKVQGVISTQPRRPGIVIRDYTKLRALAHQKPGGPR